MIAIISFALLLNVVAFVREPYIPTNRICMNVIPSRTMGLFALSKKAETYIRVKRLKQIMADGKDYQSYLEEQRRYEKPTGEEQIVEDSSNTTSSADVKRKLIQVDLNKSDPVDVMRKVLEYQQKKADSEKDQNEMK